MHTRIVCQLHNLQKDGRVDTIDACHALVHAMVIIRFIVVLPRRSHMTDVISTRLHWQSRHSRKLCVLAFRCQHGSAPLYLADYFIPVCAIERRSSLWISGYRPVVNSVHRDCNNRLAGIRSLFSDYLEQSLSGSRSVILISFCLVSERN